MNRRALPFVTMLLFFSLVSISITFALKTPQHISSGPRSSQGIIGYPPNGWQKTLTWADGSTEKITIDKMGRIFINGIEVKAFGFNIARGQPYSEFPSDQAANAMLDWAQNKEVRFMAVQHRILAGTPIQTFFNFWFPKLYAHKMFVLLSVQGEWPEPPPLDAKRYHTGFKEVISYIEDEWAQTIFAVSYIMEWDLWYSDAELGPYLTSVKTLCRETLDESNIGNVPLICHSADQYQSAPIKHSDVPTWDAFVGVDNPNFLFTDMLPTFRTSMNSAGKSGYQIWIGGHGISGAGGDMSQRLNDQYPPWVLEKIYEQPDIQMLLVWRLNDYSEETGWGAFNLDGTPRPWIESLTLYFPKT